MINERAIIKAIAELEHSALTTTNQPDHVVVVNIGYSVPGGYRMTLGTKYSNVTHTAGHDFWRLPSKQQANTFERYLQHQRDAADWPSRQRAESFEQYLQQHNRDAADWPIPREESFEEYRQQQPQDAEDV